MNSKRVAILGSTGSIGRQSLEVISGLGRFSVCALAAGSNWQVLAEQVRGFQPQAVAMTDEAAAGQLRAALGGADVLTGPEAMTELVRRTRPDIVIVAVMGSGLAPTLAAIECGSRVALANKETLVMAGAIVMPAAHTKGAAILPVDSEHSAIFQCLASGRREEVRRVTITASGGALRDRKDAEVAEATVEEALNHPTWQMGRKITIDSATLVNKALEVVEAHWLFGLSADEIQVVLHPESIVHSYVEFCDGSVVGQFARPDMALPIAYALCWPERARRSVPPLDLAAQRKLTFAPLPARCARAVELGYAVIRRGGVAGAVLNGANEAAVAAFLDGKIRFGQIVPLVEDVLNRAPATDEVTLQSLVAADAWARREVQDALKA